MNIKRQSHLETRQQQRQLEAPASGASSVPISTGAPWEPANAAAIYESRRLAKAGKNYD
jgi:hypothetical protein